MTKRNRRPEKTTQVLHNAMARDTGTPEYSHVILVFVKVISLSFLFRFLDEVRSIGFSHFSQYITKSVIKK